MHLLIKLKFFSLRNRRSLPILDIRFKPFVVCTKIEVYVFIMNCCKDRRGLGHIEV